MKSPAKKFSMIQAALGAIFIFNGGIVMADEEAKYTVLQTDGDFELREYDARVVAETFVDAPFTEAGSNAFNRLFGYISGKNTSSTKIAMTAPVTQQTSGSASGEKIAMTAPVTQQASDGKYRVTFILPATYTLATAPAPTDPSVTIVEEAKTRAAAIRYSGSWSKDLYDKNLARLQKWMTSKSLAPKADPIWARYNDPLTLPLLRRNEIFIPVGDGSVGAEDTKVRP